MIAHNAVFVIMDSCQVHEDQLCLVKAFISDVMDSQCPSRLKTNNITGMINVEAWWCSVRLLCVTNPAVPSLNLGGGWVSFCGAFCAQVRTSLERAPAEVGFRSVMHLTVELLDFGV